MVRTNACRQKHVRYLTPMVFKPQYANYKSKNFHRAFFYVYILSVCKNFKRFNLDYFLGRKIFKKTLKLLILFSLLIKILFV